MEPQNRQADRYRLVPIPWWPGKWRLLVNVPCNKVSLANSSLTQGVSTFGAWDLAPIHLKKDANFSTFTFALARDNGEMTTFIWNPSITPEQRTQVIRPIERDSTSYPWPPILEDLFVVIDTTDGIRRPVVRKAYREAYQGRSTVRIRTYVSNTPWSEAELAKDPPLPTSVYGNFNGLAIQFQECLHPLVEIRSQESDNAETFDCMPTKGSARRVGKVVRFTRTNHVTWEDHIYDATVEEEDGLYVLRTYEVIAPPLTPLINAA